MSLIIFLCCSEYAFLKSCDERVITGYNCHGTIIKKNRARELNSPHLLELLVKVSSNGFSVLIYLNSKELHEVFCVCTKASISIKTNFSKRDERDVYLDLTTCLDSSCACAFKHRRMP